ncbi:MAG: hypothetical protein HZC36_16655 [Armatimonadetes bacterium]|nr:hypothetical protein [Armatimonadota bacterium]
MGERRIWQIAAGDTGRFYGDVFFRHDVMFLGPGRFGYYHEPDYKVADWPSHHIARVRAFSQEVCEGDIVLARQGHTLVGIGVVAGPGYGWSSSFDDVFGWDLQHYHRVIWQDHLVDAIADLQKDRPLFSYMKQIVKFTRHHQNSTSILLEPLLERIESRELRPLPEEPPEPLSLEDLATHLFGLGLPNAHVEQAVKAIERQRRLWQWYEHFGGASSRPGEHEVIAHMVLPLLLALGWSEQLLAVEWKKIDLAGFTGTPTTEHNCVLVCEAKGFGHGMQSAIQQARNYVRDRHLGGCKRILLTQGERFYLYDCGPGSNSDAASGYINLSKIRTNHTLPPGTNGVKSIMALTPAGCQVGV